MGRLAASVLTCYVSHITLKSNLHLISSSFLGNLDSSLTLSPSPNSSHTSHMLADYNVKHWRHKVDSSLTRRKLLWFQSVTDSHNVTKYPNPTKVIGPSPSPSAQKYGLKADFKFNSGLESYTPEQHLPIK